MSERLLLREELMDAVTGATLLGAGGGGSPIVGKALVERIARKGPVRLVDPVVVPDSSTVAVVTGVGSPEAILKNGWNDEDVHAFQALQRHLGSRVDYVLPAETGGSNSFPAVNTAVTMGVPVVDGDGCGRAVPEMGQTTFSMCGLPVAPVSIADARGNAAILYPADAATCERMGRALATVFGMVSGVVYHVMSGADLKRSVIGGTISRAISVGSQIRRAREAGADPVEAARQAVGGYELARGRIESRTVEVRGGFDYGSVVVGDVVVAYQNENMMARKKDGRILAMVPDLICWLSTAGDPLTNTDLREGMEVAVLAAPADARWRTAEGFALFRHLLAPLGYHGEFVPVERLVSEAR